MIDVNNPYTYIICPICQKKYGNLTSHISNIHGYKNILDFKKEFNIEYLSSQSIRDKQSMFMSANNNSMGGRSQETKNKISKNRTGKGIGVTGQYIRTKEIKEKISKSVVVQHKAGAYRQNKFGIKGYYYSNKMNKEFYYNSSWEKRFLECIDKWKRIDSFYYEPLEVPYIFMRVEHIYLPDFLVEYDNGIKSIWEIKRQDLIDHDPIVEEKICALKEWCHNNKHNMFIITIKDIEKLEKYLKNCSQEELNHYE